MKIGWRIYLLVILLGMSLLAISPNPWATGVEIRSVTANGFAESQGISPGEKILSINDFDIVNLGDYSNAVKEYKNDPFNVTVKTDEDTHTYSVQYSLGVRTDNLTVIDSKDDIPISNGEKILSINNVDVENEEEFQELIAEIFPRHKFLIITNKNEYAFLAPTLDIIAIESRKNNIEKGLDLEGGTRVLLRPVSNETITNPDIDNIIAVMENRLNVYGLSDLKIRSASSENNKFILIEIAGASREEVKGLIAQQGVFEARIANELVFSGGKKDVPFVCKNDGSCSGITSCFETTNNFWNCQFQFEIQLSQEAAKKHAEVTDKLEIKPGTDYLSEQIDFYLDKKLVDSLNIASGLKGQEASRIVITGPGFGNERSEAINDASKNMDKLQTILITGSLNYDVVIEKLDSISPALGKGFIKNSILVGLLSILGVAIFIFLRYRTLKIVGPMVITILSEIVIILGFASIIKWNLDLAAIAGIIAAIGTGIDDQIVVADEVIMGRKAVISWKQRIKNAFTIIFISYASTVVAMIPLMNAGAGLIRGFALATIVGVTIGVFITRPAFASMIEHLLKD